MSVNCLICPEPLRESWPRIVAAELNIVSQEIVVNLDDEAKRLGITFSETVVEEGRNAQNYVFGNSAYSVRVGCDWNSSMKKWIFSFHYDRQSDGGRQLAVDIHRILTENSAYSFWGD